MLLSKSIVGMILQAPKRSLPRNPLLEV